MKLYRILIAFTFVAFFSTGSALAEEVNEKVIPIPQEKVVDPLAGVVKIDEEVIHTPREKVVVPSAEVEEVYEEMIPSPREEVVVPSAEEGVPAWNYEIIEG
jgi:hypothetical protein